MFTIIGGDGKEYGPVSADQIRAWIVAGRANLDTQAKAVGAADWHRLGDLPEFAPPGTALPPALPAAFPTVELAAAPMAGAALAGRGARTGAALINAFLYFLSMIPGSVFTGLRLLKEHPELTRGVPLRPENLNLAALAPGLVWIYAGLAAVLLVQCIFLATRGQNIGKLIADVRVVSVHGDAPVGFIRGTFVRFVMPVGLIFLLNAFLLLGLVFLLVDYAFMFREDRRCLHDLIAGTKVVKA